MHYNEQYFAWQRGIGEFGGWANRQKFQPFIRPSDAVMDFGCGGGYLLTNLECSSRYGVEPNESAAAIARANGVTVFRDAGDLPAALVDVVISNHALEHVSQPMEELRRLRRTLKKGGTLVLIVPCESDAVSYAPNDINQHLYSWSPMAAGNLVAAAGFKVSRAVALRHRWPPSYRWIASTFGRNGFDIACKMWARVDRKYSQTLVLAESC